MATKYLSCADTAKLIRQALKEAFHDVKFSVRSQVYAGGASIDVRWTDGPSEAQVAAVAKVFEGAYFDGSIDYKGCRYAMIDGKTVQFGADFVFCNRAYSDAAIQRAIDAVAARYAGNIEAAGADIPTVADYRDGRIFGMRMPGMDVGWSELVNRQLCTMSDRPSAEKSKTASRVVYLGNDGYSSVGAISEGVLE